MTWKEKTAKADGFLESGHKSKVYKDGKLVGESLGSTPQEARDRAMNRALKKVESQNKPKK